MKRYVPKEIDVVIALDKVWKKYVIFGVRMGCVNLPPYALIQIFRNDSTTSIDVSVVVHYLIAKNVPFQKLTELLLERRGIVMNTEDIEYL